MIENETKRDKSVEPKVQIDQTWVIPLERNHLVRNELQTPSTLKYLSKTFTPRTSLIENETKRDKSVEYAHPLSRSFLTSFFFRFPLPPNLSIVTC